MFVMLSVCLDGLVLCIEITFFHLALLDLTATDIPGILRKSRCVLQHRCTFVLKLDLHIGGSELWEAELYVLKHSLYTTAPRLY